MCASYPGGRLRRPGRPGCEFSQPASAQPGWSRPRVTASATVAASTTRMPVGTGPPPDDARRHDGPGEAEPVRLGEPAVGSGDRPDLAGQADLAEGDGAVRQRPVGDGAGQRQADRQVGGRLGEPHAADGGQVGVAAADRGVGPLVEHREDHRDPGGVEPGGGAARRGQGRLRDQRLHLGDERAPALEGDRDAGAATSVVRPDRNRPLGSVSPTMPMSDRSKQPTSSVGPYRFLTARTRRSRECRSPSNCTTTSTRCSSTRGPGDRAVLGDVPDEQHRDAAGLGHLDERRGDLADLADVAGRALDLGAADRLHRVDDDQLGLEGVDLAEHRREVGLAGEVERAGHRLDALGPGAHLRRGLLTADVEHPALAVLARAGGPGGDVEQQGGLADAGLAGHEHHGAGHDAAAEHPVELAAPRWGGRPPAGRRPRRSARRGARPPSRRWCAR